MQKRYVYDRFAVRTLHLEDPLLDALRQHYGDTAQRRGVTPMHFHPKRPNSDWLQREED